LSLNNFKINNYTIVKKLFGFLNIYLYITFGIEFVKNPNLLLLNLPLDNSKFFNYSFSIVLTILVIGVFFSLFFTLSKKIIWYSVGLFITNVFLFDFFGSYLTYGWSKVINYFVILIGVYNDYPYRFIGFLFRLQVSLIYFKTTFHRINDPGWINGDMLLVALTSIFSKWPTFPWWEYPNPLKTFSFAALLLELVAPVLIWTKYFSQKIIFGLLIFHFLLAITTNVGLWSPLMCILLLGIYKNLYSEN
jgi:hypothetical protein